MKQTIKNCFKAIIVFAIILIMTSFIPNSWFISKCMLYVLLVFVSGITFYNIEQKMLKNLE